MEIKVGRSKDFIEFLAKLLRDELNLKSEEYAADNLYRTITKVETNFIRVHADEVTYLCK